MSETTLVRHTWVAFGPAGASGTIHETGAGFSFRLMTDDDYRGAYPTLEVAKSALHASLPPGTDWPEFKEH